MPNFPIAAFIWKVVKNRRLVFTDAYTEAWEPSEKPFMTVIVTFEGDKSGSARKDGISCRLSDLCGTTCGASAKSIDPALTEALAALTLLSGQSFIM